LEALRVGFTHVFYFLPHHRMAIPRQVQHWLQLRQEYERRLAIDPDPPMPRVLPIVKVGRKWFFVDERLREMRNVRNPHDVLPL